ncbi:MAG: SIS domain-containing protein [Verrucomicrobiota bacterium]
MPPTPTPEEFLHVASDYQLGSLVTESPHPSTRELSEWANHDLPKAVRALQEVDLSALDQLESARETWWALTQAIRSTVEDGGRIFLCGCGATGRLSLSLEVFARKGMFGRGQINEESILGFMAGGDAALIRSIEQFEDRPDYGARQLRELGFRENDLLLASTEGGETPFVIGATEEALRHSKRPPQFLFCNPSSLLRAKVPRSRAILDHPEIDARELLVGPMALTGSTRMQASTILTAVLGMSLALPASSMDLMNRFSRWKNWLAHAFEPLVDPLCEFVERESSIYDSHDYVCYEPGPYGMTVLTDTTERSPTFSLVPFERSETKDPPSLCSLHLPGTEHPDQAWSHLLGRPPRCLDWGPLSHLTDPTAVNRFDFSDRGRAPRSRRCLPGREHPFRLARHASNIALSLGTSRLLIPIPSTMGVFEENLTMKVILNTHSTLVMGRQKRYEGNVMTHVAANNYKLIDRAARYAHLLLQRQSKDVPYEVIVRRLLALQPTLGPDEAIVQKTVAFFEQGDAPPSPS